VIVVGPRPAQDFATQTGQQAIIDKMPADLVTERHDATDIVYLGNGNINYIRYLLDGVEVARKTFQYTGDQLTGIVKTP
jgi:uncharacterized SAM-dependent methyltransferase